MDLKQYAKENKGTVAVTAGTGGILGWMVAKSVGGVILGGALLPVGVGLMVVQALKKRGS